MFCLSHRGTLNLIDDIIKDHDRLPRLWRDDLVQHIQPEQSQVCFFLPVHNICVCISVYACQCMCVHVHACHCVCMRAYLCVCEYLRKNGLVYETSPLVSGMCALYTQAGLQFPPPVAQANLISYLFLKNSHSDVNKSVERIVL